MGGASMGLSEGEMQNIVNAWRAANPKIAGRSYKGEAPGLWEQLETAALQCIRTKREQHTVRGMSFRIEKGMMLLRLPCGRDLFYCKPHIVQGDFGDQAGFLGRDQKTGHGGPQTSYGGRWTENVTQAASRDILYDTLRRVRAIPV